MRLHGFRKDRRGGVTIIAAISLLVLLVTTALAVDIGTVYLASRRLQGAADAAALAAAGAGSDDRTRARAALDANGLANAVLSGVTPGTYTPDSTLPPARRFVAGATPADATQVTVTQDVPLFFARAVMGRSSTRIVAKATAARIDYAAFSIGSRLAAVQGGLPGALLSGLAGTSLNLSVMDYNALASADVDILAFSDALRTQLHLDAATFGETLNTDVTLPQALNVLASVMHDPNAAAALRSIALKVPPTMVRLSNLIDLGPYAPQDHADPDSTVTVDGYSVLREMLQLANGQQQVALNLGLSLPGLTTTTLSLAIGQRPAHSPWLAVARSGDVIVRTAQARLYLDSKVGGVATLGLVSLRVPIYIELAEAQAKLASISCAGGAENASVTLNALPSVGTIAIADIDTARLGNFETPETFSRATIAHALLIDVTALSNISLGGVKWQSIPFSSSDIKAGRIRTISTGDLLQGVASSLVGKMDLRVSLLGLGLDVSAATQLVGAVITPVAPALDTLVDQVTGLLGVHIGQADLRIDGVRCGKPTLVG